jgi:hypothetical protein
VLNTLLRLVNIQETNGEFWKKLSDGSELLRLSPKSKKRKTRQMNKELKKQNLLSILEKKKKR